MVSKLVDVCKTPRERDNSRRFLFNIGIGDKEIPRQAKAQSIGQNSKRGITLKNIPKTGRFKKADPFLKENRGRASNFKFTL